MRQPAPTTSARRRADRCLPLLAGLLFSLACVVPALAADLELSLTLDPATRELDARAQLQAPASPFRFTLHESLTISAVRADGTALQPVAGVRRGGLRQWTLAAPAGARLEIDYRGTLPALDPTLDHREVLQALPPMASPAGSYLEAGSGWYPAPGRRFTYRVELTVAGGQRALVPGRLLTENLPSSTNTPYRASYAFDTPADGVVLMAGPWQVRERMAAHPSGGMLRLRTWFPADIDAEPGLAQAWLDESLQHILHYSARIGPYPYTEFSVVAAPLPTGFGMPGLTYLGARLLRLPFIRATSLGHEVLHNWWGNGVRLADGSGNWSEGLTTFMADYAYKEAESADAASAMRLGWLRDFAAIPPSDRRPLADFRSRTHGAAAAVGYGKSAMVFVMLRDLLGEAAFDRGLRRFWEHHRFKPARWDDLRAAFEAASGRDLRPFFQAWLQRADAPLPEIVRARFIPDPAGDGSGQLALTLRQRTPPYPLHLPLVLHSGDRSETRWVALDDASTELSLPVSMAPATVQLDPGLRVWREPASTQLPPILRQWIVARTPRLMLGDSDGALAPTASALAARLFEASPQRATGPLRDALTATAPLLLIGTHDTVDAVLASAGLPPRPAEVGRSGSAQVWTVAGLATPLAVISVRDPAALQALQGPLPHYGAQSWLTFDGARVIARGSWPAQIPAVEVEHAR